MIETSLPMDRSSRSVMGLTVALTLALVVALGSSAQAQDFEAVEIGSTELAPGLHMLTGRGGNMVLLVGPDGVFLIDDQYAPLTPKILAKVTELGGERVRVVLNTHWHGDHTGGNENLASQGAVLIAHENVRVRMSSEQHIAALDRVVPPSPTSALPIATFRQGITLHVSGETIHVLHVDPAHTDGDSVIHFEKANVIHTGDIYFAGMYPFIDHSSGGRVEGIIKAADRILGRADRNTKIVPGHGPVSNRKEFEAWRKMIDDVRRNVNASVEAGMSTDDIVADRPTAKWDERYGGGFMTPERFVRLLDADARMGR